MRPRSGAKEANNSTLIKENLDLWTSVANKYENPLFQYQLFKHFLAIFPINIRQKKE
jgi:hypothetical protein